MKRFLIITIGVLICYYSNAQTINIDYTISDNQIVADLSSYSLVDKTISVSGTSVFPNSNIGYVRILLTDNSNYDMLIYESIALLAENGTDVFSFKATETINLPYTYFNKVKVEIKDAQLSNLKIHITNSSQTNTIQQVIGIDKASLINQKLEAQNALWRAGETDISRLTYEEKKSMFGGSVPDLQGFEYYKSGIFSFPSDAGSQSLANPLFPDKFDWRNRHGKNWMTPPRHQGTCGACVVFAMTGVVEALANLYFNQNLNLDLSEQKVMACDQGNCKNGWTPYYVAKHYKETLVGTEEFMPYAATDTLECPFDYRSSPILIRTHGFERYEKEKQEDSIKRLIVKYGPVSAGIGDIEHAMTLLGFGTVKAGDKIDLLDGSGYIIVPNNHPDIGKTYWIFKNSYGKTWGESGGFARAIIDLKKASIIHLNTPIIFAKGTTPEIVCEDRDGDGYYYWGIGEKPETCPDCPDEADGDDSNPGLGPMDEYGNCSKTEPRFLIRDNLLDEGNSDHILNRFRYDWSSPDINLLDLLGRKIKNLMFYANPNCSVAVSIQNIGGKTHLYSGKEKLHLYWYKSVIGSHNTLHPYVLPIFRIGSEPFPINQELAYGERKVAAGVVNWELPNFGLQLAGAVHFQSNIIRFNPTWGFSIMAIADDGTDVEFSNIANNPSLSGMTPKKLAEKYSGVAISNGGKTGIILKKKDYCKLMNIRPILNQGFELKVNQLPNVEDLRLSDFAELYVVLSNDLVENLIENENVKRVEHNIVQILSPEAVLSFNPIQNPEGTFIVGAKVNFISDLMPEYNEFDFDLIYSEAKGAEEYQHAMRFTAVRDEEAYFKAQAEASETVVVKAKESVTLTSNTIFDEATYTWTDENGEVIGEGYEIEVTPEFSQNYKVEIERTSDGYKSYGEVRVEVVNGKIEILAPNPATSEVKVVYILSDNVPYASIQISDMQNIVNLTYPIYVNETEKMIPLGSLAPGVYFVKLLVGGQAIDSKQLIVN